MPNGGAFTRRVDDSTLHVYARPQVLTKAALEAELVRIDKMLALSRKDVDLFIEAMGGQETTEVLPPDFGPRLRARKQQVEAQIALWDLPTTDFTVTVVRE